jgi:PAS domain S-box-containing protein
MSLAKQLYLSVVIIACISVLLTSYFVGVFFWNSYISLINDNQQVQLNYAVNDLNNWIDSNLEALRFNTRFTKDKDMTLKGQIEVSQTLMKKYTAIQWIGAYTPDKALLYSTNQDNDEKIAFTLDLPSFEQAVQNKVESTGKVIYINNNPLLMVYIPIVNDNEETVMVLTSLINLRYMAANISSLNFNQYGYVYVMDEHSNILATNFTVSTPNANKNSTRDYFFFVNNSSPRYYKGLLGKKVFANYKEVKATQWFLVTEYPLSLLMAKIWKNLAMMFIALVSALSLGLLGVSIIYQSIRNPLKQLTDSAEQISKGNYAVQLDQTGSNELGTLSKAFNTMSEELCIAFSDIQQQLAYEKMVAELSALFVQTDSSDLQNLHYESCKLIGDFAKANVVVLYLIDPLSSTFKLNTLWGRKEAGADTILLPSYLDRSNYPYLFESLSSYNLLPMSINKADSKFSEMLGLQRVFGTWLDRPVKDSKLFQKFLTRGIVSLVGLPLKEQRTLFGIQFLLFDSDNECEDEQRYLQYSNLASLIGTSVLKAISRKELHDTSEKLSITLNSIDDAVISVDGSGLINLINPIAEEIIGYNSIEVMGKPIWDVFSLTDPETKTQIILDIENTALVGLNPLKAGYYNLITRSSVELPIEVNLSKLSNSSGENQGIVLVFRDISDRLRAEQERQRIEKHEALGYLAAGIAHDFNNLLGTILGSVSLAKMYAEDNAEATKILSETETVILGGKDVASQLFALDKNTDKIEGNSHLLTDIKKLVKIVLYNTKIQVRYNLTEDLPPVKLPDGTVNQIVTNLLINSAQALGSNGEIQVITKLINVDQQSKLPLEPGAYIQVNLIDNGPGIPQDQLEKVFLPYYTTKETGTGLGIPTVLTLITKYGGNFRLRSRIGTGTDAELFFPVCEDIKS